MQATIKIKKAVERSAKALALKPSLGLNTGISKTRVIQGLKCEIQEGPWRFFTDMPEGVGGDAEAPTPGVLGRAAFGSCIAITYMLYAARLDIPVSSLEVKVEADYDDGALLGTSKQSPGYNELRFRVAIETEASEDSILKMLDLAEKHSPYLHIFSQPQRCKREVFISSPKIDS